MSECSNCGRECERIVFCRVCRRELLCGRVAEPCTVEGCAERRIQEQYNDASYLEFLEDIGIDHRLIEPRHVTSEGKA